MRTLALITVAIAVLGGPVRAQELPPPLTTTELEGQTGGLRTPMGFEIGFGAVVSTYVDGQLALQTRLTWGEQGAVKETTSGVGAGMAGLEASGLGGAGLVVPGGDGNTVVLHDLTDGHIASLVFNAADNRDIRQDTAITLSVPNLEAMQADFAAQQLDTRLQDAVGRALSDATR